VPACGSCCVETAVALPELAPRARQWPEAIEHFSRESKLGPGFLDAFIGLGKSLVSAPYLEKAIQKNPQFLPGQRSLGLAYLHTGQAEKAIPHLKQGLSIDEDGSLHYQVGRAYQAHGEKEVASAMLKQYQEMHAVQQAGKKRVEKEVAITPPE
jgi:tetratricopeptide (TPR) repeat protein